MGRELVASGLRSLGSRSPRLYKYVMNSTNSDSRNKGGGDSCGPQNRTVTNVLLDAY